MQEDVCLGQSQGLGDAVKFPKFLVLIYITDINSLVMIDVSQRNV